MKREPIKPRVFESTKFIDCKPDLSRDELIESIFEQRTLNVVYGASGSGKSHAVLSMIIAIVSGEAWMGHPVAQGPAVYVAGEGYESMNRRLDGYKKDNPELASRDLPFILVKPPVNLTEELHVDGLIEHINTFKKEAGGELRVSVFDTLNMCSGGINENESSDMGVVLQAFRRIINETKAAVIIIHHTGKDEARGARGHSSLKAAVDTEVEIRKPKDASGNGKSGEIILQVTKQRDLPIDVKVGLKLRSVAIGQRPSGREVMSCVVEAADVKDEVPPKKLPRQALQVLEEVRSRVSMFPEGRIPREIIRSAVAGWDGMTKQAASNATTRALNSLSAAGIVRVLNDHVTLAAAEEGV